MIEMETNEPIKEHCNLCLGYRNHVIIHSHDTGWNEVVDEDGDSIGGGDIWKLLKCMGCDSIRLKHLNWFSEACDGRGIPIVNIEFFPPSINRQKPIWRRRLFPMSDDLRQYNDLCDEIYSALAMGAHRLAAMGIRALAERLMIDRIEDQGSFEKNINAFFEDGHIALNQRGIFEETLIEAGHAAMHRDFDPSADTINTLLDIIETTMHTIYYAPLLAADAKKTIPSRRKRSAL